MTEGPSLGSVSNGLTALSKSFNLLSTETPFVKEQDYHYLLLHMKNFK